MTSCHVETHYLRVTHTAQECELAQRARESHVHPEHRPEAAVCESFPESNLVSFSLPLGTHTHLSHNNRAIHEDYKKDSHTHQQFLTHACTFAIFLARIGEWDLKNFT